MKKTLLLTVLLSLAQPMLAMAQDESMHDSVVSEFYFAAVSAWNIDDPSLVDVDIFADIVRIEVVDTGGITYTVANKHTVRSTLREIKCSSGNKLRNVQIKSERLKDGIVCCHIYCGSGGEGSPVKSKRVVATMAVGVDNDLKVCTIIIMLV